MIRGNRETAIFDGMVESRFGAGAVQDDLLILSPYRAFAHPILMANRPTDLVGLPVDLLYQPFVATIKRVGVWRSW